MTADNDARSTEQQQLEQAIEDAILNGDVHHLRLLQQQYRAAGCEETRYLGADGELIRVIRRTPTIDTWREGPVV
jgi:hypothetical protein